MSHFLKLKFRWLSSPSHANSEPHSNLWTISIWSFFQATFRCENSAQVHARWVPQCSAGGHSGGIIGRLERSERGWKLLLMLPRMLLFKNPRKGTVAKEELMERLEMFCAGRWDQLLADSRRFAEELGQLLSRRSRRGVTMSQRADRALRLVQLGELSSARQALEGAEVAPGDRNTLAALQDPVRRPAFPRDPLPEDLLTRVPARLFELDKGMFSKNLRSARRGAAAGPSGMTVEHLQPLLDHPSALHSMFLLAERLARADVPPSIVDAIRQGRLTTLRKPNGGGRGIVVGDVIRRVVARTLAQQLGPAVEGTTAPFQYALSTKAGCECVSHVVQALTEADPETTVVSIDGVSDFDLISREATLDGLLHVDGGCAALPLRATLLRQTFSVHMGRFHGDHSLCAPRGGRGAGRSLEALTVLGGPTQGIGGDQQRVVGIRKVVGIFGRHLCHHQTRPCGRRVHSSSPESVDTCVREHQQWQDEGVERRRRQASSSRDHGQNRTSG